MIKGKVKLGRINAAYGLKGWVKVYSDTDPMEQILTYSPWWLRRGEQEIQVEVEKGRTHGRSLVVLLPGIEDRNQAEGMIGHEVWIDSASLPQLESGEYYWHQLEGLTVVNQSDLVLGKVDSLMETGANDVMVVSPGPESFDDAERLIPFVKDVVVKEVNIEAAIIVVAWESDY